MTTRNLVKVFNAESPNTVVGEIPLPDVFKAPIRADIVKSVFNDLSKNKRQAHGVNKDAGMLYNAESWGTGRAVARIPRVGGSGTSRSGQGAFGNMCRGGRMFNPKATWRRWHRKVNLTLKKCIQPIAFYFFAKIFKYEIGSSQLISENIKYIIQQLEKNFDSLLKKLNLVKL